MEFTPNIKISKARAATIVHFTILAIAGLSTILRPSIESKITLFRILLPFLFITFFLVNTKRAVKLSVVLVVFLLYSLIASYVSRFHAFNINFNLYYITVFFFYFYYKEALKACNPENLYLILTFVFKAIIILSFVQVFFGGVYINTQDRLPAVNIFFWNENELSSVLAIFSPLFFLKTKNIFKYVWLSAAIYLMAYNDAKLAILSLIVFFGGYFIVKIELFKIKYIGFVFMGVMALLVLFFFREYSIQGKYTIEYFTSRLVENLWLQEPLEHIGTFNSRSNAVILGVKEFFRSYLLGIGPGNSLTMMKEIVVPGTERYAALSMHNFTLQLVTEMGLFGLGMIGLFFLKIKQAANMSKYPTNLVFIFFISCVISITLLSGAWSNYFYLFILYINDD